MLRRVLAMAVCLSVCHKSACCWKGCMDLAGFAMADSFDLSYTVVRKFMYSIYSSLWNFILKCELRKLNFVVAAARLSSKCARHSWTKVDTRSVINWTVLWPTTSCFADWSKRCHVTLSIIDCQEVVLTCCKYSASCLVTSSIPARSLNQT